MWVYGEQVSVAASCTGGLLSKRITDVPGASVFYKGGACTYCNEIKMQVLGVKQETLEQYTAVSSQTAREMAEGIAKAFRGSARTEELASAPPLKNDPALVNRMADWAEEYREILQGLADRVTKLGLDVKMIDGDEVRRINPYLSDEVICASWCLPLFRQCL